MKGENYYQQMVISQFWKTNLYLFLNPKKAIAIIIKPTPVMVGGNIFPFDPR